VPPPGELENLGVQCPCCGGRFTVFDSYGVDENVECPRCLSHPRHRLLWLFFEREGRELIEGRAAFLHIAPEECLEARFRAVPTLEYLTADLTRPAMAHFDIAAVPYADDTFDVILCSHVLEHVADDRRALRELHRVLRPGGSAIVLVPLGSDAETFEDATITSPEKREAAFGQFDHMRRYGQDFPKRLEEAGFRVAIDRYVGTLDERLVARYAARSWGMWVCTKDSGDG
jgi:SAM-dependent methyltransferase